MEASLPDDGRTKRLPPMKENIYSRSRRRTPWTDKASVTPLESFLDSHAAEEYSRRHPKISDTQESEFLNTFRPEKCPYCGNKSFVGFGHLGTGLRRYICKDCGRTFTILTGTLFENHKQPISEWIDTCLELFSEQSFESISKANRKAYNTTRYWIDKLFLALKGTQDGIMLSGKVYLDETYLKVIKRDVERRADGKEYRGISRNQICIGIAYDCSYVYCCILGHGKPSQKAVYNGFKDHIAPGSTLIHDKEKAHKKLVQDLRLESIEYDSKQLKGLPDQENPLEPINRRCYEFQRLMRRHPGFSRDDLSGYLDLYSYIHNPPNDKYEKVENLIKRIIENPNSLKYRD